MKNKFTAVVLSVGIIIASGSALAAERPGLQMLDANHDGMISREEAAANPMLTSQFDAIDTNHDGQLTRDEIRAFRQGMQERFVERFNKADLNHDGALSREEAAVMPMIARQFDQIDLNHDGKVTLEEVKAFRRMPRQQYPN